jgi:hypothetical protein
MKSLIFTDIEDLPLSPSNAVNNSDDVDKSHATDPFNKKNTQQVSNKQNMSVNISAGEEDFNNTLGGSRNTSTHHASKSNYQNNKLMSNNKNQKRKMKPGTSNKSSIRSTTKNFLNSSVAYSTGNLTSPNAMNPMTTIKMDIESSRIVLRKAAILREKSDTANEDDQLILLTRENNSLKNMMIHMNHGLTRFVEALKGYQISKLGKHKYGNENQSVDYKLRTRDAESMNYNKMLTNLNFEKNKLRKRLDVVGDHSYAIKLRRDIIEMKQKNQALKEEKSELMSKKFSREKKMSKVFKSGQPDSMHDIQLKAQEMNVLFDRLEKINTKLEFQKTTKDEQDLTYEETKNKLMQLESKARENGIYLNEFEELEDEDFGHNISQDPSTYDRKENIMKQSIESERQSYAKILDKMRIKLVGIMKERNDVISKIRDKQIQTVEIRGEVNELMVKSRIISEEDAKKALQDTKDKVVDLPEELIINQDKIVAKLNGIVKSSKKKVVVNKVPSKKSTHNSDIPTTEKAFTRAPKVAKERNKESPPDASYK